MSHKKNKKITIKWNDDQKAKKSHSTKAKCKPKNCPKPNKLITASIILFSCSLFIVVTIFFTNTSIKPEKRNPTTITTQTDFDTIKTTILQNKKLNNTSSGNNNDDEISHVSNNIAYINDKYIAIIKENEIFLVTAKNDLFITSINISSAPSENNVYYYNIFAINNNIFVTGYKKDAQELEVTQLHLNENLTISRDAMYLLPSLSQNHDTLFTDDNLVFYTTHDITSDTTTDTFSSIKHWSQKDNQFITSTLPHQSILYDKILSPIDPVIHTITLCPFIESILDVGKCTQKQIIDSRDAMLDLGNKNILLTTNNSSKEPTLTPTYSYTKKYHIPTSPNKDIYISTLQQPHEFITTPSKNVLLSQKLPNDQEVTIYKKENKLFAKIISKNKIINTPFYTKIHNTISNKYTTKILPLIQDDAEQITKSDLNIFNFNDSNFISIALNNSQNTTGRLNLFKINDDAIQNMHSLPITSYDANIPNQFFANTISNKLYALTNNYLRQFKYDTNSITLARTINYTRKPVYKPRLKIVDFPVGAKKANGKYICKKKRKEYVGKSKKNNKGYYHLDRECCLDPDEYPNPWCTYRPGELSRTNLRYKDYTGKKIKR